MIRRYVLICCCAVMLMLSVSGCSVYMAAKQPAKKDVDLFKVGTSRSMLLAEFGQPTASEVRSDGKKYEIYKFVQGYSGAAKASRALFHGVADFFTIGLWEVIGTPTEGLFNGDDMAYEVRYDVEDKVDQVVALKAKEQKPSQENAVSSSVSEKSSEM